jgi:protein-S-isoprenylcysteine O-methyltransferase Ste14
MPPHIADPMKNDGAFALGRDFWLDVTERAILLSLGLWLIYSVADTIAAEPFNLLLLFSELLVVCFVLVRRPGRALNTPRAWALAAAGSFTPLLVLPGGVSLVPLSVGAPLMATGVVLSVAAKATLRRSFGIVAANRGVQIGGPYGLVRHPMYAGYLSTHIGFLLLQFTAWNALIYGCCWMAMLLRIDAEEGILREDPTYRAYCERVRYRLLPGIW